MIKTILLLAFLTLSFPINAALMDLGTITRDTESNLDWLDLTETTSLSYLNVLDKMAEGGELFDWRYATFNEVVNLFEQFGITGYYEGPTLPGHIDAANLVSSYLGDTGVGSASFLSGSAMGIINSEVEVFNFTGVDEWYLTGVYATNTLSGQTYLGLASGIFTTADGRDYIGSYLVQTSPIPVPAAVWLFGSGLIGLIGFARRKKA